jgi:type II secretory ATPase GspE/PulE/Tfp pilus assembly ATPase PilB-like protein
LITKPYGIILSTGPTGSGKTTTLYSALTTINTIDRHIITIEDPVEYRLGLIRQIQVNAKAGITFANGLRAILRQDPDVIMVGEIRDLETAVIAVQAALTGHLVFSTLHTNDAPSAITRLVNMGVEPFLISACLIGVMAQRLVRKICDSCKEPYQPSKVVLEKWGLANAAHVTLYHGKGCDSCKGTGYRGRAGIFELMVISDEMREMIVQQASALALRKKAQENGMKLLSEDGLAKVLAGVTTLEEISRVSAEQM